MRFQPHDDVPQQYFTTRFKLYYIFSYNINKDNHKIFSNGVVIWRENIPPVNVYCVLLWALGPTACTCTTLYLYCTLIPPI